jgi:hypothetical protein
MELIHSLSLDQGLSPTRLPSSNFDLAHQDLAAETITLPAIFAVLKRI